MRSKREDTCEHAESGNSCAHYSIAQHWQPTGWLLSLERELFPHILLRLVYCFKPGLLLLRSLTVLDCFRLKSCWNSSSQTSLINPVWSVWYHLLGGIFAVDTKDGWHLSLLILHSGDTISTLHICVLIVLQPAWSINVAPFQLLGWHKYAMFPHQPGCVYLLRHAADWNGSGNVEGYHVALQTKTKTGIILK